MVCVNGKTHARSANEIVERHYHAGPAYPDGHVFLTIEFIGGFEFFNTRPYHNHETWAEGWRVGDGQRRVENECLLCALEQICVPLTGFRALS